jgi:hypothetical protein
MPPGRSLPCFPVQVHWGSARRQGSRVGTAANTDYGVSHGTDNAVLDQNSIGRCTTAAEARKRGLFLFLWRTKRTGRQPQRWQAAAIEPVIVLGTQAAHSPQPRRRSGARAGAPLPTVARDRAAALGKRRIAFRQNPPPLLSIDIAVGVYANTGSRSRATARTIKGSLRKSQECAAI